MARGFSTQLIAHRLNLSTYTVQDHLKSIFTKSDTGSRGDLVARLFIDHYADGLTSGSDIRCDLPLIGMAGREGRQPESC